MNKFMAQQNKLGFHAATGCTIGEFVEQTYFPDLAAPGLYYCEPPTRKTYRDNWKNHLHPLIANERMRTFTPAKTEPVMARIAEKTANKLAHSTYANIKVTFSAIFTHAIRRGVVQHNPVSSVSIPKGKPSETTVRAYSLDEIFQHMRLFDDDAKAIIATVAFAGLRGEELRGLWSSDDRGDYLEIRRTVWKSIVREHGKTEDSGSELAPAEIPIIPLLRKILDKVEHKSGWLFRNTEGGFVDLNNVAYRIVRPALKAARLKWHGWHAYRRGLASKLKELGVDDMVIQRIMRHKDVSTTRNNYIKVRDEGVAAAMRQLENACTAFVQPEGAKGLVN
jgi:integrase